MAVILFLNRRPTKTLLVLTVLIAAVFEANAGSPRHISGTVSFEPAAKGTPLTWADGTVTHYTDRGAFSPILSEAAADALVANAFSRWTSISTAATVARRGGQLDCDRPCNRRSSKFRPALGLLEAL